jgi:high-affinity nickel permease
MPSSTLQIALLSAAILGFHHGFDYDHVAALSDIVSVQTNRMRAMPLSLLYAVGHAATVTLPAAASGLKGPNSSRYGKVSDNLSWGQPYLQLRPRFQ